MKQHFEKIFETDVLSKKERVIRALEHKRVDMTHLH